MCIVFTCGEQEFQRQVQGYEGTVCRCHNCGNYSARVVKRNPWFTFCFIPVIPLSMHGYEDVVCSICRFSEPLQNRPDVMSMRGGGNGMPLQSPPPGGGGPPQGWGGGGPPKPQGDMQYR
ncbi:hypothetical protein F5884DRAFT_329188 [Xylogone sp. PMI_703]|nr:hypothetical protein F5884DRAFT_329188 [Xylogone sp. PMI_703]